MSGAAAKDEEEVSSASLVQVMSSCRSSIAESIEASLFQFKRTA